MSEKVVYVPCWAMFWKLRSIEGLCVEFRDLSGQSTVVLEFFGKVSSASVNILQHKKKV